MADYIYLDSDASTPHTTNFNVFASVMLVIYFAAIVKIARHHRENKLLHSNEGVKGNVMSSARNEC